MVKVIYCSSFADVTEGDTMGREVVLRAIKDAESEARAIRAAAETKANETISSARVKATEASRAGRQGADEDAASLISEARASSDMEAAAVSEQGDAQLKQVAAGGEKNRDSAVGVVLSAFSGD